MIDLILPPGGKDGELPRFRTWVAVVIAALAIALALAMIAAALG